MRRRAGADRGSSEPDPTDRAGEESEHRAHEAIGHARTAAWTGLAFAALLAPAIVGTLQAPGVGAAADEYRRYFTTGASSTLVTVGLHLVPFAGIAFLWHMTALRTLLETRPSRASAFPYGLQLAAGIVFVCMLFAGTSGAGAVAVLTRQADVSLPPAEVARVLAGVGYALMFIYGVRVAGVFMITTTGLLRHAGLLPGWLTVVSYVAAIFLLVSTTFHPTVMLVLPGWVTLVSIAVLVRGGRSTRAAPPAGASHTSVPQE